MSRAMVLTENNIEFQVIKPDIDEKQVGSRFRESQDARQLVLAVSQAKLDHLIPLVNQGILVTCDQVTVCNGRIREKPTSAQEAFDYIKSYAHFPAETWSGMAVKNIDTGKSALGVEISRQYFKPIPDIVIQSIVDKGKCMHSSGAFMIEDPDFIPYLSHREGDPDAIRGMPLKLLNRLIEETRSC